MLKPNSEIEPMMKISINCSKKKMPSLKISHDNDINKSD